jgi:hypothetical protein
MNGPHRRPQAPPEAPDPGPAPAVGWCPSGLPDRPESVVLGVRSGADGRTVYLADPVPAAQAAHLAPEGAQPRRVLRFASHCESACPNRVGESCGLVDRIVALPDPAVGEAIPPCHLRAQCRWWQQTGVLACHRCPAASLLTLAGDRRVTPVADPATTIEQLEAWIAAEG